MGLYPSPNPLQDMEQIVNPLLRILATIKADYTLFFRHLCHFSVSGCLSESKDPWTFLENEPFLKTLRHPGLEGWYYEYAKRLGQDDKDREIRMLQINPKFILRNHLAQKVIESAESGEFSLLKRYLLLLEKPFDSGEAQDQEWAQPPPEWAQGMKCSCSS